MASNIRQAVADDCDNIRSLHLRAFPDGEGEVVAKLAVDLLEVQSQPKTVSLVAENDSQLSGHICFSPVYFDDGMSMQGYILAPLAVSPDCQKQGIGSGLIGQGIQQLKGAGVGLLLVYGDPDYYGRFGFQAEPAASFIPPCELQYPFGWQAIFLNGDSAPDTPVRFTCVEPLNDPSLW